MSKRYFWLKLVDTFFDRQEIKIIESQENGSEYLVFYVKLLLKSVEKEGALRLNEKIPYTDKTLSVITSTNIDIVRSALNLFVELDLIKITHDNTIFMQEIPNMIGSESDSAQRVRKYRAKQKAIDSNKNKKSLQCNTSNSQCNIEKEKEKDLELEKNKDLNNNTPLNPHGGVSEDNKIKNNFPTSNHLFNTFWKTYPKHTNFDASYKQFEKLNLNNDEFDFLIERLKIQCSSIEWTKEGGRFIPYPDKYLKGKKWFDELTYQTSIIEYEIDPHVDQVLDDIFKQIK